MLLTEQEIYGDLLLRKPGADELSSPRKEPDLPIIYTGLNAADTIKDAGNRNHTNGTPLTILIPNLDRHFIHIEQYQDTNRTPRPGHASYATFMKYGPDDDAIGCRYFQRTVHLDHCRGRICCQKDTERIAESTFSSFVREAAGVRLGDIAYDKAFEYTEAYKRMRCDYDPFYQAVYVDKRITPEMRFLEKTAILAEIENQIDDIRATASENVGGGDTREVRRTSYHQLPGYRYIGCDG